MSDPEPWTGREPLEVPHLDPDPLPGSTTPQSPGASAARVTTEPRARTTPGPARRPDYIYNPDGTIVLAAPQAAPSLLNGRIRRAGMPGAGPTRGARGWIARVMALPRPVLTVVTMLISIAAYTPLFGQLALAVGFVLLLFVHEMGHYVVIRMKGVVTSVPIFIPYLGAVISMRSMPRTAADEAHIAIAGPVAGMAAALACLPLAIVTGSSLWLQLALSGLWLNLFNLLPVSPLDGGRIAAALTRWLWPLGLAGLLGLAFFFQTPLLLLVLFIGGTETVARFRGRYMPALQPGYNDLRPRQRLAIAALYMILIAIGGGGIAATLAIGGPFLGL